MNKFKQLVKEFKQTKLELGDAVAWVHYYNQYPIALLARFVEYSGFYKKSQIMIIEVMDETQNYLDEEHNEINYGTCGVGSVGEEAVFPLIFADDPLLKPFFESETKKDQVASLANPTNLVSGREDPAALETAEDLNRKCVEAARKLNEDLVPDQTVILVENIQKKT